MRGADSAGCQVIHLSQREPRFILPRIARNCKFSFAEIYRADKKKSTSFKQQQLVPKKKRKKKGDIKGKTNIFNLLCTNDA